MLYDKLPVVSQSVKIIINNCEEFFTATECFRIIEYFKDLEWDLKELVIYQSNMSNTIGGPVRNVDHILLRTYEWLYLAYGNFELTHQLHKHKTPPSESQQEFPWNKSDLEGLFSNIRPYYYLCYNGQLRPHRQYILSELFKRKINKKGLISCLNSPDGDGIHVWDCENHRARKPAKDCCGGDPERLLVAPTLPDRPNNIDGIGDFLKLPHSPQIKDLMPDKEFISSIPMILDIETDGISNSVPTKDFKLQDGEFLNHRTADISHFKDSYFSLVTESNFLSDDIDEEHNYTGECMFITEKTYRALCFHPTIIAGNHGILKYLRSIGFHTFPEFFDESYDDEVDDHKRMLMVVDEVHRICNLPIEEIHTMAKTYFHIVLHNQSVMKKYGDPSYSLEKLGYISELDIFEKIEGIRPTSEYV